MQFKFRPLQWSDYAQCRQICHDNFDPIDARSFIQMWKQRHVTGCIAVTYYDVVVGFAFMRNDNYLAFVAVHQEFQNQRLGTYLLNKTLEAVRDEKAITLRTPPDMRLVRWYERHGFRLEEHFYDGVQWLGTSMIRRQRPKRSGFFSLFSKTT
jgi:ribosomal protein S18 acetylase RimI-like enzyme